MSFEYNLHIVTENSEFLSTWKEEIIYGKKFYGRNFNPYLQKISSVKFFKISKSENLMEQNVQFFRFWSRLFSSNFFRYFQKISERISSNEQLFVYCGSIWKNVEHDQITKISPVKTKIFEGLNCHIKYRIKSSVNNFFP